MLPELAALVKESSLSLSSFEIAAWLDERDELKGLRKEFSIPLVKDVVPLNDAEKEKLGSKGENTCVYFCGNSLGLLPLKSKVYVEEELDVWAKRGVVSHFNHPYGRPWVSIEDNVVGRSAELIGAKPDEVAIMNTLTGNLHYLLTSFYQPTSRRYKILMEEKPFPSDRYAIESQLRLHGFDPADALIFQKPREGEYTLRTEDILSTIEREGESIALVLFSGVQYYTGQLFEIEKITKAGHSKGCIVGFDLAHAVGNVPMKLNEWGVDFACWCTYKYLNSGPGGIAGLFVHEKHSDVSSNRPRFGGWWGVERDVRFQMDKVFPLRVGAAGYQLSNPSVLNTVSLLGSLQIFEEVTMPKLRAKSKLLTAYLEYLLDTEIGGLLDFKIITPRDPEQRGCQLSLILSDSQFDRIFNALMAEGVVCDERRPNCIRIAPVPLYNTFMDVRKFIDILKRLI
ncbi:uncharacterized protein VTP21DRAFT_7176 [Calcarisporiella thermophila]|uniref:uncharacterized protein n=1 Tax=Calcarisporiella thermophila TaxID=911321 RepID=UPI003743EB64